MTEQYKNDRSLKQGERTWNFNLYAEKQCNSPDVFPKGSMLFLDQPSHFFFKTSICPCSTSEKWRCLHSSVYLSWPVTVFPNFSEGGSKMSRMEKWSVLQCCPLSLYLCSGLTSFPCTYSFCFCDVNRVSSTLLQRSFTSLLCLPEYSKPCSKSRIETESPFGEVFNGRWCNIKWQKGLWYSCHSKPLLPLGNLDLEFNVNFSMVRYHVIKSLSEDKHLTSFVLTVSLPKLMYRWSPIKSFLFLFKFLREHFLYSANFL